MAAGGVADGRGLAAALMLGADGDATIKTHAIDVVRGYDWPDADISGRALKTGFVSRWNGREEELAQAGEQERYWNAFRSGDADNTGVFLGEAAGLIHVIRPAGHIVEDMAAEAERLLGRNDFRRRR